METQDKGLNALKCMPLDDIRSRFYYMAEEESTGWPHSEIRIFDKTVSTTEPIYSYQRNYAMLKTFEPFRLWDNNVQQWRNFALISPVYTTFEVLDLDNKEIIAKNPFPKLSKEQAESLNNPFVERNEPPKFQEEQEMPGWGFCSREFHVPDVVDILADSDIKEFRNAQEFLLLPERTDEQNEEVQFWAEWLQNFMKRRTFGLVSGCIWGDDWSWKIQAIELSGVLDGIVSNDDRFGYFLLSGALNSCYGKEYFDDDEMDMFSLNTPVVFGFDKEDNKKVKLSYLESEGLPGFTLDPWGMNSQ